MSILAWGRRAGRQRGDGLTPIPQVCAKASFPWDTLDVEFLVEVTQDDFC
jgi:hypothetical protein